MNLETDILTMNRTILLKGNLCTAISGKNMVRKACSVICNYIIEIKLSSIIVKMGLLNGLKVILQITIELNWFQYS